MERFKCQKCGKCCNYLQSEQKFGRIPRFSEPPFIILNTPGLVINDFEKDLFPNAIPYLVVYDKKKERTVVLLYTLNTMRCPHVKDDKCTIYNKRPAVCRAYPCPYSEIENIEITSAHGFCPAELPERKLSNLLGVNSVKNPEFMKNLYARYGEGYLYKFMNARIRDVRAGFLAEMNVHRELDLAERENDFNELLQKIKDSEKVPFSQIYKERTSQNLDIFFSEMMLEKVREKLK